MNIFSPYDSYVQEVFVYLGQVKKGDKLMQLYSPALDEKIGSLMMTLEASEIQSRPFTDGRIDDKRQAQKDNQQVLEQKIKDYQEILESTIRGIAIGNSSYRDAELGKAQALNLQPSYLKQKLVVDQFDKKITDAKRKLELVINRTKASIDNLQKIKQNLLIRAPFDGIFESRALPTLFYQQDEVIGIFTPPFEKKHHHLIK